MKYNPNVSCTCCGKTGHVERDCFRKIGFPNDFEFTKSKADQGKANGVIVAEEVENPIITQKDARSNNNYQHMSKEQYDELVQ